MLEVPINQQGTELGVEFLRIHLSKFQFLVRFKLILTLNRLSKESVSQKPGGRTAQNSWAEPEGYHSGLLGTLASVRPGLSSIIQNLPASSTSQ